MSENRRYQLLVVGILHTVGDSWIRGLAIGAELGNNSQVNHQLLDSWSVQSFNACLYCRTWRWRVGALEHPKPASMDRTILIDRSNSRSTRDYRIHQWNMDTTVDGWAVNLSFVMGESRAGRRGS